MQSWTNDPPPHPTPQKNQKHKQKNKNKTRIQCRYEGTCIPFCTFINTYGSSFLHFDHFQFLEIAFFVLAQIFVAYWSDVGWTYITRSYWNHEVRLQNRWIVVSYCHVVPLFATRCVVLIQILLFSLKKQLRNRAEECARN